MCAYVDHSRVLWEPVCCGVRVPSLTGALLYLTAAAHDDVRVGFRFQKEICFE